jgi:hypothetical protein
MGECFFVPEGHHDSSQARSAWIVTQRRRPGGTVEVSPVPEIFVVERSPGMSKRQHVEGVECLCRFINARYSY